jgi:hypothetical protein
MRPHRRNPAARADAGRASKLFCLPTERLEVTQSSLTFQVAFLARRLGALDSATLATIASLAFSTLEAAR